MLTSARKKEQKTLFGCMYEQYLSKKNCSRVCSWFFVDSSSKSMILMC